MYVAPRSTLQLIPMPSASNPSSLRDLALTVTATDLAVVPSQGLPNVWGVLMETGYPEAVVTLVGFADGTTSLYFSNGGGIIGAGEHVPVREATARFLQAAETHLGSLTPVTDTPVPAVGRIRFYVRTFAGTLGAETSEDDLGYGRHPLSPLFHAGHAVITAARAEAT